MVRRRTSPRKKRSVAYTGLRAAPAKRSGLWVLLVLGVLVVLNLYVFVWDKKTGVRAIKQQAEAHPTMTLPEHPLAPAPIAAPPSAQPTLLEGKVAKADTLGKLLKRSGLTAADGDEVIHALSGVLDYKAMRIGETYRISRGPDGRVQRFELDLGKSHHVRADRKPSGELVGTGDR